MQKTCSRCKITKDVADFNKDKYSKDGYTSWCKKCQSRSRSVPLKKRNSKKITEATLQYLVDNWTSTETTVLARTLGVSEASISAYASILRKLGVELPPKPKNNNRETFKSFASKWLIEHKKSK